MRLAIALVATSLLLVNVQANDHTHEYTDGEEVTVWMNKIGPYHNPQETYDYYKLPFCRPDIKVIRHKHDSLGVVLEGSDLIDSGLPVHFKEPQHSTTICTLEITEESAKELTDAVRKHYWYQMYIDELPLWGMVGEYMISEQAAEGEPTHQGFVYTHKEFSIAYNGNRIVEVNLTSESPKPLVPGEKHAMTFSVTWVPSTKTFEDRFDRYLDFNFFEHQIHWFSIFNSFMMVVFLVGVVALILFRTLRSDYARYTSEEDDLELDRVVDESGWKQVHADVFRAPPFLTLYSALLGTGFQLLFLAISVLSLALATTYYDERGMIISVFIGCYSLTSVAGGYFSGKFYKKNGGNDWKKVMILTASLFPWTCFAGFLSLNVIALQYESQAALHFNSMMLILGIWLFVQCPLTLVGTMYGRATTSVGGAPCRISAIKRPIPDGKWYTRPVYLALLAGILPFGSIFIEMYFVFTSFWNYKFYYVYGFMFLVFCILFMVIVCVTIVATYFLLNAEDYRWHWTSFCVGASTALYVFLYAVYYFFVKTRMHGFMQTSFYFGYMGMLCMGLALLCGSIGYLSSSLFVHRIYQSIHTD